MREEIEQIRSQITKVILGKQEVVESVLMAILASGHVLLEDVPGVGKTTLTLAFAKTMGLETKRMQFTSDSVPSDVIGFSVLDKRTDAFVYKPGAVMTNLLLADEIYRYITALTEATRTHPMIQLGVSPRGAFALMRMARARAYLNGRDFCIPEDVAQVVPMVYPHRLVLSAKARFNERTEKDLMEEILQEVPMPVLREMR